MKTSKQKRRQAILRKYKFIYRNLPAAKIQNLKFTSTGFKHFLYHRGTNRNPKDLRHRLSLIPLIPQILATCPEPSEIRGQKERIGEQFLPVRYYAFDYETADGFVRMITRQVGNQTPTFRSLIEMK